MLAKCPNCRTDFAVDDEVFGNCPKCSIALLFRAKGQIIEKVSIEDIDKKVDNITCDKIELTCLDHTLIEHLPIEIETRDIEKMIDEL